MTPPWLSPPPPPASAHRPPSGCALALAGARRTRRRELAELERLRDHPSPRVQNAVGDRLARLGRRRPDMVGALCRRWLSESPSPATRRIVRRALGGGVEHRPPGAGEPVGRR